MSFPIKTNCLEYTIDRNTIWQHFDIYCVSTSEKYFAIGAQVLDAAEFAGHVLAVLFERGNKFYVLTKEGVLSSSLLRESLGKSKEAVVIKRLKKKNKKRTQKKKNNQKLFLIVFFQCFIIKI